MAQRPAPLEVGPGIWRVVNRTFPSNTYVCATADAGGCFVVDPGTDPEGIDAVLVDLGLEPSHVFCTHGHFDHVGSAAFFQQKYGAPCYLHEADSTTLGRAKFLLMAFKIPFTMELPRVTPMGDAPGSIGGRPLTVLHAPGHTPGSCLIRYEDGLFSGDTLFSHGVGLSKLPGGDRETLKATLLSLWDGIPDDALVCPGHGDCSPFLAVRTQNRPLLRFLGMAVAAAPPRDARAGTA